MTEKTLHIKHPSGHVRKELWIKSGCYCPNCGKKEVWVENAMGDYYEGPTYICLGCEYTFSLPRCHLLDRSVRYYTEILEGLKNVK